MIEFMVEKIIITVRMSHQNGNYVSPSANLTVTVWNVCVAMFTVNEQKTRTLERKEARSLNHVACKSIAIHSHNLDSAFTPLSIEKQSHATLSKYNLSYSVSTRYSLIACFLSPPLSNSCERSDCGVRRFAAASFDGMFRSSPCPCFVLSAAWIRLRSS